MFLLLLFFYYNTTWFISTVYIVYIATYSMITTLGEKKQKKTFDNLLKIPGFFLFFFLISVIDIFLTIYLATKVL